MLHCLRLVFDAQVGLSTVTSGVKGTIAAPTNTRPFRSASPAQAGFRRQPRFLRAKNFEMADATPMRRACCCYLIAFGFLLGCAQNNYKTAGFPGNQDRSLPASRDYDQRERVDDSINFSKGNFDPDPDFLY
ncbi:MAG: hypothetical protein JO066_03245 [Verrucomicrobia bacterium]|nr:hypothetical protein [Verrucomicrobiota bacterium]